MNAPTDPAMRVLTVRLPDGAGGVCEHEVLETQDMSVLSLLKQLRGVLPAALRDASLCHAGACNTCGIVVDGQPGVACSQFTRSLGPVIDIAPGEHARGWDALRDDTRKVHGS
ncbi:2Fe-2S iron-sulfur cluster-binding protein [Zoogloea sp.]|jgi:succinate dehydrogenase/fumarate reductase-like Fe-S protein|uniref:2Fe-2S iron-sulfur cluster-binding protein n=1 Tax=Zoogloea sp. TaxID=49181 RepID=UPI0037DA715A